MVVVRRPWTLRGRRRCVDHAWGQRAPAPNSGRMTSSWDMWSSPSPSSWKGSRSPRSVRQARRAASAMGRDLIEHVLATSDPTLRAVFAEDAAALIGLVIATGGLAARQLLARPYRTPSGRSLSAPARTGWSRMSSSIATVSSSSVRRSTLGCGPPSRGRYGRAECRSGDVPLAGDRGAALVTVVGHVDLSGDDVESRVAVRLRALEATINASPAIASTVLSLSAPDEPSLSWK